MSFSIFIDGARALDLLAHRVRDHESLVYMPFDSPPTCRYQDKGCPSCLIGAALFDAGVPIEILQSFDNLEDVDEDGVASSSAGAGIHEVRLPEWLTITPKAMAIFQVAQSAQDARNSWGVALQRAIEAATKFGPERVV
jgi:hypothetical protein